jgi:hypothetical protein
MTWVATAVIGGAVIGAGASVYSSGKAAKAQTKAAEIGAEAQSKAADLGITEQRRQFNLMKEGLAPYSKAGISALPGFAPYQQAGGQAFQDQLNLAGLGGQGAQQSAIQQIEDSAQFQALTQQGENAILQNASATGGLRGGNIQASLAQFRPQLLNQQIEQQYARLGGIAGTGLDVTRNLVSLGQSSAAGTGAAGIQTGQGIANLYSQQGQAASNAATQIGQAQAGRSLAQGQAFANFGNSLGQAALFSNFGGGGGVTSSGLTFI